MEDGAITEAGFRLNVDVALQYLNAWLSGNGAAAIYNLMEDAATAEISRAQLWQWIQNGVELEGGRTASKELYKEVRKEELERLKNELGEHRFDEAAEILDELVLNDEFTAFLTLRAYEYL